MFYYIQNDQDAKNLYDIFITVYHNNKDLSDKELYELVQSIYFEKYVKDNLLEEASE